MPMLELHTASALSRIAAFFVEEIDVSEANIVVSKASKLSAGIIIFRGP